MVATVHQNKGLYGNTKPCEHVLLQPRTTCPAGLSRPPDTTHSCHNRTYPLPYMAIKLSRSIDQVDRSDFPPYKESS